MKILHICSINGNPFSGINIVVPQHVMAQKTTCDVAVLNLHSKKIDCDVKQLHIEDLYSGKFNPDIVLFHGVYFLSYVKISRFLKKINIPYVVIPHCSLTKVSLAQKRIKKFFAIRIFFSSFLKGASAIQFLTDKEKETSIYSNKGFVCGNGVAIPSLTKKKFGEKSEKKFIYVGRLDVFHKGIDILLDAIELEKKYLKEHHFILNIYGPKQKQSLHNGEDAQKEIRDMIFKRNISQLVTVHDAIYGEKKIEALLNSDFFIQTSRFEGLPLGILEALSLGLPCIVTEGTNTVDFINKYKAGWGVETNPQKVAEAIKFAINVDSEDQLKEMSSAAMRLISEEFTWNKIAEKEISEYKRYI
ncbi:Glycosyltransferase involved in cell wall bisynthesis [Fibrobacter sp. UWB16]|uniref:glycosyltransferase n=1 Tax=Fibrobacter sp. UWB16 TaxID=1945874 RepID=UPI000BD605F3|nr:glycosyltransferase [Fibrobacter sp. UWB16]SOD11545.1 Glycosyltransferase involved in cell wall bisynthesis [Fibrobacter sp. UWB16]